MTKYEYKKLNLRFEIFNRNLHSFKLLAVTFFTLNSSFLITSAQSARLPYTFNQFKTGNNALENRVIRLLKDSKGFLWLGTMSGLVRYDQTLSISFKNDKKDKNSLIHNDIQSLCEDKQGRIWVGTTEGICYFDSKKNHFVRFETLNRPDYVCRNLICDSRGNIWFTIRNKGLYKFDAKTNQLSNFIHDEKNLKSISSNLILVNGLLEDPNKNGLWIASKNKLNFFDFATQSFYHEANNPKKSPIFSLSDVSALTLSQNQLVFANNDNFEISWYDLKLQKIVKSYKPIDNNGHPLMYVHQLFFDANNDIWLSTSDVRMAYINTKENKTIQVAYEKGNPMSFSANNFIDILQEKNGTIWFATINGISIISGLDASKPNDQLFSIYDFSKTIFKNHPKDGLMDFVEDTEDSTWWMISINNRLVKYNQASNDYLEWKIPLTEKSKNFDFPERMVSYQNKLLIFKHFNFLVFDKKNQTFNEIKTPKGYLEEASGAISHAKVLGDSVWIFLQGVKKKEVLNYHFKTKRWKVYQIVFDKKLGIEPTINFAVTGSLVTKRGEFWLALHGGGLAKFSNKLQVFEVIKTKQNIDFARVGYTGFEEDKEGKIWIGTYDLVKFDPKTYDFQSILDTDMIGSMTIDDHDNICMATLDEIRFFNEKKHEKYLLTLENNEPLEEWGKILYKLKNSKILLRNKQTAVLINYKGLKSPSFNDQLYINQVASSDTVFVINQNETKLNFGTELNSFAIYFGVLASPNTELYEYFYQLEGYDKAWIQNRKTSKYVSYANLSGGDYVFKVKAVDVNGKALPIQTLYIHKDTPFYSSLWFRIFAFLATAYLAVSFIRYRANQRNRINHLLLQSTRLEKDKTEIQYQNLINHLNPHFLFNSLTSLNSLILTEPKQASKFLQKLSAIYRYILQNKEKESVTLEHELNFVKNYIDLQKSRFDAGLQFNIDIDEDYLGSGIVPVTLQNLFENAIKHNTVEEEKPLVISVLIEDDYLIVKNNLQKKKFVETSNKQGLDSLKNLYKYLTEIPLETIETDSEFIVKVPLI